MRLCQWFTGRGRRFLPSNELTAFQRRDRREFGFCGFQEQKKRLLCGLCVARLDSGRGHGALPDG